MSTSRERILSRLRQAQPAVHPPLPPLHRDDVFADLPPRESWCEAFCTRLRALHGEVFRVADEAAAATCLAALVDPLNSCLRQRHPLIDRLVAAGSIAEMKSCRIYEDLLPGSVEMADFEAGITVADWLIARTGSIVVRATGAGGRRMSVLPPLHIVVATEAQVVGSLEEALAQLREEGEPWSMASVITGPSRTADIEKILVLGAHGPKRLAVILLPASTE